MSFLPHSLSTQEHHHLDILRRLRASQRLKQENAPTGESIGSRIADTVASIVGSWRFIIIQSILLAFWIAMNVLGWVKAWDPYPFILLNLALSFQAAYTAPVIMMSQNRQNDIDRDKAKMDYDVNLKAELEIELLHQKIDLLRETEIVQLTQLVERLSRQLDQNEKNAPQ